jgi:hypothetical protein
MRIERVDPLDAGLVRACHAVHEALGFELAEPGFQFFAFQVTRIS